jgi:hypothetical protein
MEDSPGTASNSLKLSERERGWIGAQIDLFAAMLTAFRQTEAGAPIGGSLRGEPPGKSVTLCDSRPALIRMRVRTAGARDDVRGRYILGVALVIASRVGRTSGHPDVPHRGRSERSPRVAAMHNYADHGITQMAGELIGGCAPNR